MTEGTGLYPYNSTLGAISVPERRAILAFVHDQSSPVSEHELAQHLAMLGGASGHPDGSSPRDQSIRSVMVHTHLPALTEAGLLEWDRDTKTVATTTHPALADVRFEQLVRTETTDFDAVLSVLAHDHRRIVLTVLKAAAGSVTRRDLAREVRRHEIHVLGLDANSIDEILIGLHHNHLPKLVDTDLITYDPTTDRATYASHPGLDRVFSIIFEQNNRAAEKLDGFLCGLADSYRWISPDKPARWPHHWRNPSHE